LGIVGSVDHAHAALAEAIEHDVAADGAAAPARIVGLVAVARGERVAAGAGAPRGARQLGDAAAAGGAARQVRLGAVALVVGQRDEEQRRDRFLVEAAHPSSWPARGNRRDSVRSRWLLT